MKISMITRRHFFGAVGATVAGIGADRLFGAEPAKDNIRLCMMLQGGSVALLQKNAQAIAAVGFERVQVTFFAHPTADELKALADTLKELKLKTVAL